MPRNFKLVFIIIAALRGHRRCHYVLQFPTFILLYPTLITSSGSLAEIDIFLHTVYFSYLTLFTFLSLQI